MNRLKDFFESERNRVFLPDAFFTQRVMARYDERLNENRFREIGVWDAIPSSTRPVLAIALLLILSFVGVRAANDITGNAMAATANMDATTVLWSERFASCIGIRSFAHFRFGPIVAMRGECSVSLAQTAHERAGTSACARRHDHSRNAVDVTGESVRVPPLGTAAFVRSVALARLLLDLGADVNGQPIENKRRNKGQFIADFKHAYRVEYNELSELYFHKREPACVIEINTCNPDPGYPAQVYSSDPNDCSGKPIVD
jgi:hypothetical protein